MELSILWTSTWYIFLNPFLFILPLQSPFSYLSPKTSQAPGITDELRIVSQIPGTGDKLPPQSKHTDLVLASWIIFSPENPVRYALPSLSQHPIPIQTIPITVTKQGRQLLCYFHNSLCFFWCKVTCLPSTQHTLPGPITTTRWEARRYLTSSCWTVHLFDPKGKESRF